MYQSNSNYLHFHNIKTTTFIIDLNYFNHKLSTHVTSFSHELNQHEFLDELFLQKCFYKKSTHVIFFAHELNQYEFSNALLHQKCNHK